MRHEIKAGMSQSAVLEALGAPHRVTTDSQRRQVWTYEGIASDRIDTESSVGGGIIVSAVDHRALEGARHRTLTLIIYYDEHEKVRDLAYNYSSP